jgi:hypothetical protein
MPNNLGPSPTKHQSFDPWLTIKNDAEGSGGAFSSLNQQSRIFVLAAQAGIGNVESIAQERKELSLAHHYICPHDDSKRRNPKHVLF